MEKEYCQICGKELEYGEKTINITEDGFKELCAECALIEGE